ncbi:MAG: HEPN domain-containing protein [Armatimonadetes bacterium]|nr:HEPN domain-containing protein [Armatimonadota bacterium]
MPVDPARLEDVQAWLRKAASDLRAANLSLSAVPPLLDDVVFHCQQAAEKAVKGFLAWHDTPFRKTHSLLEVGNQAAQIAPELERVLREAAPLSEYAWRYRYPPEPGEAAEPEEGEAREALHVARDVLAAVVEALPAEARPPALPQ